MAEAERIINPPLLAVAAFSEALTPDMKEQVFAEFNTLSIIYQVCVRVCMCVCVHARVCVCMRMYTLFVGCVNLHMCASVRACVHLCVPTRSMCAHRMGARLTGRARGSLKVALYLMEKSLSRTHTHTHTHTQAPSSTFVDSQAPYHSLMDETEEETGPAQSEYMCTRVICYTCVYA